MIPPPEPSPSLAKTGMSRTEPRICFSLFAFRFSIFDFQFLFHPSFSFVSFFNNDKRPIAPTSFLPFAKKYLTLTIMSSRASLDSSSHTTGETSPLLSPHSPQESGISSPSFYGTNSSSQSDPADDTTQPSDNRSGSYLYVVTLVGLFSLVADMGGSLIDTPEVRLLEMAVCRDYYRANDPGVIGPPPQAYVPEQLCKIKGIQRDLAYLRATRSLLMTLPGNTSSIKYH